MARNAIERDFFVGLIQNVHKKIKVAYWSQMARNAIGRIQNGRWRPFCEQIFKKKLRIDLKWREMRLKVIFGNPNDRRRPFCEQNYKQM